MASPEKTPIICKNCGLILKVSTDDLESCPVCGSKLPYLLPRKKKDVERKKGGYISLERVLFGKKQSPVRWKKNELYQVISGAFLLTYTIRFIMLGLFLQNNG
ncbi:MAG: hypothetical protein ACTSRA_06185 [Promethearchaeota archaeon]